ncbi:hypothetical protein [Oscillatoria nigro-viridis]|uniref:hypothetical protein n=1 Tax=Phormidium nigroviride TaxID=482564 RepID=UPI0005A25F2F|nr:hypothetical protein [Oscillatoria nigro-viridis]
MIVPQPFTIDSHAPLYLGNIFLTSSRILGEIFLASGRIRSINRLNIKPKSKLPIVVAAKG